MNQPVVTRPLVIFSHGNSFPGGTYTQTPNAAGQVTVYCHIHGQGTGALNIIVQ